MKNIAPILAGILIATGAGVLVAHAQSYTPLAPLPGTYTTDTAGVKTTTMSDYLSGMITLLIALGAATAILFAIIGGTQYVASGIAPSAKQDAKNRITNAFIGLALMLTSYLILNSINPELVDLKFSLPSVQVQVPPSATSRAMMLEDMAAGGVWGDDAFIRNDLRNSNITVNRPNNCTTVGETGCTSLAGLGPRATYGLKALRNSCPTCLIRITGGTEYWLHGNRSTEINANPTGHKPGGNVVDLTLGSPTLDNYIKTTGSIVSSGCSAGTRYQIGSAIYVNESESEAMTGAHWHVCY